MRAGILFSALLFLSACSHMIFYPDKGYYLDPEKVQKHLDIKIEDVYFQSRDGTKLHGWFLPNQVGKTKATILFLHGNAENISTHIKLTWWLPRSGYNVFMPDYRGYGKSLGSPDLEGIHEDIQAAIEVLLNRKDVNKNRLIMYGQSLGGALATTSLADSIYRDYFKALIVEGSFTGYRAAAREALGSFWLTWLFQWPLSFTVTDDFKPVEALPRVSPIPVLLVHGAADNVIAPHHSKALFAAAREPKQHWLIEGSGHAVFDNATKRQRLLDYLKQVMK